MVTKLAILVGLLVQSSCTFYKSEHRKFFEEEGHRYVTSQGQVFKVKDHAKCTHPSFDINSVLRSLVLVDPNSLEEFCLLDVLEPREASIKSWICPMDNTLTCWEDVN